jgi:diguanylate cyclase (GGDEF)-like protein
LEVQKQQLKASQQDLISQNEEMTKLARQLSDANAQLSMLTRIDPMTGLLNRRSWEEAIQTEHERYIRYGDGYAVIMIDIDHFKAYNDSLGHQAGDDALRRVATCVDGVCRSTDFVGRYGGEEFMVLLPDPDPSAAVALANRIVRAVAALAMPHRASRTAPFVTVSVGVAASGEGAWEGVVKRADKAMYAAKRQGRNQVVAHESIRAAVADSESNG